MFETIRDRIGVALRKLRGTARLTESNIRDALRDVRMALLEADVNYKVVRDFINQVTQRAIGEEVMRSVTPGQLVVKIVQDELVRLMGPVDSRIPYSDTPPTKIMLAGLQGSGKTTTAAKLARYINSQGHHSMLVAADVRRPAAIEQLRVLGEQVGVPVFSEPSLPPPKICEMAIQEATRNGCDVVIMDTAGRLHVDDEMMAEVREIAVRTKPDQIYLVCDAMTGQDAVNSAEAFNQQLELDGIILTKLDGDARGGAALSVKAVTGKPIKFVGVGEKLDQFEPFHPERMASRILGMGDIVSFVEKAQEAFEQEKALELQDKIRRDKLTLEDFLDQLRRVRKMGPLRDILSMLPGFGSALDELDVDDKELDHVEAIIQSMTKEERLHPEIIDASRRQRIAAGSGTTTSEVSQLLKNFRQMRKMLKRFSREEGARVTIQGRVLGSRSSRSKKREKRKKNKRRRR